MFALNPHVEGFAFHMFSEDGVTQPDFSMDLTRLQRAQKTYTRSNFL